MQVDTFLAGLWTYMGNHGLKAVVTHICPKTRKKTNPNCTPNLVFCPKIGWFYFNF